MKAYETVGYKLCRNSSLEVGVEKIAIFGVESADGTKIPTHASLQLESGEWTSKLGPHEDILHKTEEAVNGPVYGKPVLFMSRLRATV
jgi:hypothetical protein